MPWVLLVVAGILEAGWAVGLKFTNGFTKPLPSALTIAGIVTSMYLLAVAARTLPIGTAYAVWVGIGAAGTAQDNGPGTDFHAVSEGYIALTPIHVDLTRYQALESVSSWAEGLAPAQARA